MSKVCRLKHVRRENRGVFLKVELTEDYEIIYRREVSFNDEKAKQEVWDTLEKKGFTPSKKGWFD